MITITVWISVITVTISSLIMSMQYLNYYNSMVILVVQISLSIIIRFRMPIVALCSAVMNLYDSCNGMDWYDYYNFVKFYYYYDSMDYFDCYTSMDRHDGYNNMDPYDYYTGLECYEQGCSLDSGC